MPSERPRIVLVSRCFVKGEDGALLAIKRAANDSHYPGMWECAGGKLDEGQDLSHAQEREVMEETGYLVEPIHPLVLADSYVIGEGAYKGLPYVVLFSITRCAGGIEKLSDEHDAALWVGYQDFLGLPLTPEVRKAAIKLKDLLVS